MSKYKGPPPEWSSVWAHLDYKLGGGLFLRVAIQPSAGQTTLYVCVELVYDAAGGRQVVLKRWGENAGSGKNGSVQAAAYRQAVQANLWLDGKAPEELHRWARWQVAML